MSDILIRGMEMPTSCGSCPFEESINFCYGKKETCPLVPVPPHGRLIDADALITTFCEWGTSLENKGKFVITMAEAKQTIVDIIEDAPTIIPASEEGE